MNVRQLRALHGPNVWAACPVLEVTLELEDDWPVLPLLQAQERLGLGLAQLAPADAFAVLALKLQTLAGTPVSFSASRYAESVAAVEFAEEGVGRAAVDLACRLLRAAWEGQEIPLSEELKPLEALAYQQRLPVSTAVIYHAARARGIPADRLNPEYSRYLRLGQGSRQHRTLASEPDTVSAVARTASTDKHLAKQLLQAVGVPVPQGRLVSSAEEAWAAASELGLPVATKPLDSDLGTGVSLDLRDRERVEAGFRAANEYSRSVLVERFAPGLEHRVLVVGGRISAVTRVDPPQVVGDGISTIEELVQRANEDPRRGDEGSGAPLGKMKLDVAALSALANQGHTLSSVPKQGECVLVRRNPPYFTNGGRLVDQTERIHPANVAHAIAAAEALRLSVAGLDVVAVDIGVPLEEQGGVVVEINAGPGLWLHLAPWADTPRPVGEDIVASLFPPGDEGRIPVIAVVGDTSGSVRGHLAQLFGLVGERVGFAGAAEISAAGRRWPAPGSPRERAALLMQNPTVDLACLETTPRELVESGFGNDRCNAALVLAPFSDPGGAGGAFLRALRHALAPGGTFVLPAEAGRPAEVPSRAVFLLAPGGGTAGVGEHLAAGGRALLVQGKTVCLACGNDAPVVLGEVPGRIVGAEVLPLLGALAVGLALELGVETLADYLRWLR